MVQASYLLNLAVLAYFSAETIAVRKLRLPEERELEMLTFSMPENIRSNSNSDLECMLGLAGDTIEESFYSRVHAFDDSQLPAMRKKYEQFGVAKQIFDDLEERMDSAKQYIIKFHWVTGPTEFRAQAEAAELGVAPQLAAGWVCHGTRHGVSEGVIGSVLVMERMEVSLARLYEHLCEQLTVGSRAEVTRVAALVQRTVLGLLERLSQRGVKHNNAHIGNFMLDGDGRARAINLGIAEDADWADEGDEARRLSMFRHSLPPVWSSAKYPLYCLKEEMDAASLWQPGSGPISVGTPSDRGLQLLGIAAVESLLKEPYSWATFQSFVECPLGREPLVSGLLDRAVVISHEY